MVWTNLKVFIMIDLKNFARRVGDCSVGNMGEILFSRSKYLISDDRMEYGIRETDYTQTGWIAFHRSSENRRNRGYDGF